MMQDFNSIDKLVDFGMGIAMARQMIDLMNSTLQQSNVPVVNVPPLNGTANAMPSVQFYLAINDTIAGPITETELNTLIANHKIDGDTLVWMPGMQGWRLGREVPLYNKYLLLCS